MKLSTLYLLFVFTEQTLLHDDIKWIYRNDKKALLTVNFMTIVSKSNNTRISSQVCMQVFVISTRNIPIVINETIYNYFLCKCGRQSCLLCLICYINVS